MTRLVHTMSRLMGAALLTLAGTVSAEYADHVDAPKVLAALETEHGFNAEQLSWARAALGDARKLPQLIRQEQTAPERTETWTQYARRIDDARIRNGAALLQTHAAALADVEREYGVPPAIVAAVLGIETRYGRITGGVRVLDALATQGLDHPTRTPFFRSELVAFLALAQERGWDPREPKGSYAGAMGAAQFMPSNYRRLAVDMDGDGTTDLWQMHDAIGSIGRYFVDYRPALAWRRGEPLLVRATASAPLPDSVAVNQRQPDRTFAELGELGLQAEVELPDTFPVGILRLPLDNGEHEYWLALHNFYAVMTYNPRVFYAMAVAQLAASINAAAYPAP
jgi:membrane-bound lytic murein transglycosylase B